MKGHLRQFLFNWAALWLITETLAGASYQGGLKTLASAALVLTLVNLLVKPLLKMLLLPINLLTLGAFRWLINVAVLYLVTLLIPQFQIKAFLFSGLTYQGFVIPPLFLTNFWALVVCSLLISLVLTFLNWLVKK